MKVYESRCAFNAAFYHICNSISYSQKIHNRKKIMMKFNDKSKAKGKS